MESQDPTDHAYVTELNVICHTEHVAEVLACLPSGIQLAHVPARLPRELEGQPGLVTLLGVVPDGVWTPEAQNRLAELGQQGIVLRHGTSKYRAGTRFVTFDELLSGKYAGQLVAVRQWDMPRPGQLPPGVTVTRSSRRLHGMSMPPQEDE